MTLWLPSWSSAGRSGVVPTLRPSIVTSAQGCAARRSRPGTPLLARAGRASAARRGGGRVLASLGVGALGAGVLGSAVTTGALDAMRSRPTRSTVGAVLATGSAVTLVAGACALAPRRRSRLVVRKAARQVITRAPPRRA